MHFILRHGKTCSLLAVALLLLNACGGGGAAVVSATIPDSGPYVSAQYTDAQLSILTDVAYSTRANAGGQQYTSDSTKAAELGGGILTLKLDIAVPPNATAANPQPLIVWIHGGGFSAGGKENMRAEALSYARAGYVATTVNYRLTPNNMVDRATRLTAITQATEDVMNAIRFLKANAALYHIDASRIATIGSSAGGGISLINAVEFDTLQNTVSDDAATSSRVAAVVSTGATLIDSTASLTLNYQAGDSPVLLFHASPTDSVTGATWGGNVLPTRDLINASGNSCTLAAQADMTHVVDLSLGSVWWPVLKPFLWERLRLGAL
jgi:dienelactone hydrolase